MTERMDALRQLKVATSGMLESDNSLVKTEVLAEMTGLPIRTLNQWGERGKYPCVLMPSTGGHGRRGVRWWPVEVAELIMRDQDAINSGVAPAASVEGGHEAVTRAREMLG